MEQRRGEQRAKKGGKNGRLVGAPSPQSPRVFRLAFPPVHAQKKHGFCCKPLREVFTSSEVSVIRVRESLDTAI